MHNNESMNKSQLSSNFQKHTSKSQLQKLLIDNFYRSLITLIKPLRLKTILDVGCGEGFSLSKMREQHIGTTLEGIDYSKKAISLGKKMFPNLSLKQGSIYKLPYKNNTFDLVLCTEVLEHLNDPQKGYKEVLRVAKKYIVFSVPNEPFFMLGNFLRGKNILRFGNDPEHIQHWTIFSFRSFLEKNNLKIKTIQFPFPWIIVFGEKKRF